MKTYSVDLRERRFRAIDVGLGSAEAVRPGGVGTSTIGRWQQRRRRSGDLRSTPRAGPGSAPDRPRIGPAEADVLRAQVAADPNAHPDATLAEHGATWARQHGVRVSVATMSRLLRRLDITVTKRPPRRRAGRGPAGGLAR